MDSLQFSLLLIAFFFIALFYASVGFGGGSSYLALLALFLVDFTVIRSTALLCNIVVVSGGTYIFFKEGKLDFKKAWPLVVASVPMAYVGGLWPIQQQTFFIVLAISLVIAAITLFVQPDKRTNTTMNTLPLALFVGGGLGFLSGLVGIGGGIFLAPILHFIRWDEPKKIAALASFFILVNSISGILGQLQKSTPDWSFTWPLLIAVFIGGQAGSRLGTRWFNSSSIKKITAILIGIAGTKILLDHLTL